MSSADTTRNGYSESSSGPLQRVNPPAMPARRLLVLQTGCPDQNSQHQGYQPGKVLWLIHTHTLLLLLFFAPGGAFLHSGSEGADVARKRRQHISLPDGFSGCSASHRPIFYGRTSVYLSGSILEIEHFRRIRSYDDGELCLELGKGLLTIYGSQLKISPFPSASLCGVKFSARNFPGMPLPDNTH